MLEWIVILLFAIVFWVIPYLVWFKPDIIKRLTNNIF